MPPLRHILTLAPALMITVATLNAPRHALAFDYVANGSFESDTSGWSVSPGARLDAIDASEGPVEAGTHAARITLSATTTSFSIEQHVTLAGGSGTYHVTAWMRTGTGTAAAYAQILTSTGTSAGRADVSVGAAGWAELSADIEMEPYISAKIVVGGTSEPGAIIYVDGITLDGSPPVTPEPTSTPTLADETTPVPSATPNAVSTPEANETPAVPIAEEAIGPDLRNGDFESTTVDGLPAAWRKYGGKLTSVDSPVHGGSRAARLQSDTDSTKWLYQTVSVSTGARYEFGARVLDDDVNVRAASLRISWYASLDGSGTTLTTTDSLEALTSPAAEYRFLTTGAIEAPADAHSARLRVLLAPLSAAPASIFVDDAIFGPADPALDEVAPAGSIDTTDTSEPQRLVLGAAAAPNNRSRVSASAGTLTAASGALLITEVMYDPLGDDAGEWIELYNRGDAPISLAGWSLEDAVGSDRLASGRLGSHEFVVLAASDSFRTSFPTFSGTLIPLEGRIGNGLGNSGDRLLLRDPSGTVVDAISWGNDASVFSPVITSVPTGHSIERRLPSVDTDSAADWVDNMHPSPGSPFVASAAPDHAAPRSSSAQTLAAGDRSLAWLIWWIVGGCALVLLAALSWRAAPVLTARLRRQA